MAWHLEEAISYYKSQGAPGDQTALTNLLLEIQQENGGSIPSFCLGAIAENYGIKESFLLAVIKRMPRLRLSNTHELCLCAGPNCGKHTALAACAEKLCAASGGKLTLKFVPCMRLCGKGPNVRYDGTLYHRADEALLRSLAEKSE
jgi:NADH:ubiquinone oxidoreductase subunit E